jgi:uncharacterized repeat protein (TIGR03803 family)
MNSMIEGRAFLGRDENSRARAGWGPQILPLGVALALTLATAAYAQSYQVLKSFTGDDGMEPQAGLVLAGSALYGTTYDGGTLGQGVVFKVNIDGSGYSVLKNLGNADGAWPEAGLLLSGSTLYGTTAGGSSPYYGVVFRVNTDGSGFSVLKTFTGSDGANPHRGLVLGGSTLYGTTPGGGGGPDPGYGVVFKVNTDGSGYEVLKRFSGSDGRMPEADLVLWASTLYGTTVGGGDSDFGVVFKVNTDGSGYSVLKNFTGGDGMHPQAGLLLSGTTLYGTTDEGGTSNAGVVFEVNTDGSGYAVVKRFTGDDGMWPRAKLVLADSTLYGTAYIGGSSNCGVVFKVNTDGSDYAVVKRFSRGGDGYGPLAGLVLRGTTLYGTAAFGGSSDRGVVFSLECLSITTPPSSQTAEAGSTVDFRVEAESPVPGIAYQWLFGGTNSLTGATNAVLELTNVQPAQAGAYTVVVTNAGLAVTGSPALLSVIPPVSRRTVPTLTVMGQPESFLNLDSRPALNSSAGWEILDTVSLTNASQRYFDVTVPFAPQRFYRAWQTNVLSPPSILDVHLVPAITVTGAIGSSVRIDAINQFGPIDAWVTLDTVTLTNTSQLYFDTSAWGQPARLYRLVPVP